MPRFLRAFNEGPQKDPDYNLPEIPEDIDGQYADPDQYDPNTRNRLYTSGNGAMLAACGTLCLIGVGLTGYAVVSSTPDAPRVEANAPAFPTPSLSSEISASASPTPSETSISPSPTTPSPTPAKTIKPTPTRTHKVVLPSPSFTAKPKPTHTQSTRPPQHSVCVPNPDVAGEVVCNGTGNAWVYTTPDNIDKAFPLNGGLAYDCNTQSGNDIAVHNSNGAGWALKSALGYPCD